MATESQVREIRIKVDTQGDKSLTTIANNMKNMNKQVKETTFAIDRFQRTFLAIQGLSFAGVGIMGIKNLLDGITQLDSKLKVVTGSTGGAEAAFKTLTGVANRNYTAIEDVANIFQRLQFSLSEYNLTTNQAAGFTETLLQSFRLTGASAAEVNSVIIQLTQGLASGQVRGQELRSITEANAKVGELLAREFGIARGALLKFADKNGGLEAVRVMKALANGAEEIAAEVALMKPTIEQTLIGNMNDAKVAIRELNKEFDFTGKIVDAINFAFRNADIAAYLLGIAAASKAAGLAMRFFKTEMAVAAARYVATSAILIFQSGGLSLALSSVGIAFKSLAATLIPTTAAIGTSLEAVTGSLGYIYAGAGAVVSTAAVLTGAYLGLSAAANEYLDVQKNIGAGSDRQLITASDAISKSALELDERLTGLQKSYVLQENALNDLDAGFLKTFDTIRKGTGPLSQMQEEFKKFADIVAPLDKELDFDKNLAKINQLFDKGEIGLSRYNTLLKNLKISELDKQFNKGQVDIEQYNQKLKEIQYGKFSRGLKDAQLAMKLLNAEFKTSGDIAGYSERLRKLQLDRLNADFKEGRKSLIEYRTELNNLDIAKFNSQLASGAKSFQAWDMETRESEIKKINDQWEAGTMSIYEHRAALVQLDNSYKFTLTSVEAGILAYYQSAGTMASNVAAGVQGVFGRLEDSMFTFLKTGRSQWKQFTEAVLDDLLKIAIRSAIVQPLAGAFLGGDKNLTPASAPASSGYADGSFASMLKIDDYEALGGAFNQGKKFFARGGIVNRATAFGMAGGKTGIMGEAGPEAILPLSRGKDGSLGVSAQPSNVVVNIVNNSDSQAEVKETTNSDGARQIDVMITAKIKQTFASGAMDKQMQSQYGLNRRGN